MAIPSGSLLERAIQKAGVDGVMKALDPKERFALFAGHSWGSVARPSQLIPSGDWLVWLLLSGRGFGKTRVLSEVAHLWARDFSPIALVAQTKADARDVMVELGESSILKTARPWFMPTYEASKRRVTWPNGAVGIIYSGDEPDQLRGPQHAKALMDELAKFKYPKQCWDNLMFGLRVGNKPQVVVATTPRPIAIIKSLVGDKNTFITRGHTLENKANLAPSFLRTIMEKYDGTRLGRQELAGEVLEDNPGALWKRGQLDKDRLRDHPPLTRIVVAIDPEATSGEESAETGIIAAGLGADKHGYVLGDVSLRDTPAKWGSAAITAFHSFKADRIVAETNNGGEMVEHVIHSIEANVPYKALHASRGKVTRAEPVSALYEQGKVHHIGFFPELEDQLCEWEPGMKSPDRLDALVWVLTELMINPELQIWV